MKIGLRFRQLWSTTKFMLMFFPAMIFRLFIKNSWMICEDKNEARDNGYWFYKYVVENRKDRIVHYAISKKIPDYKKVKKLGNVVVYDSMAHWFWYMVARCSVSSQASGRPHNGIAKFLEKLGLIKTKFCFLQHGVTINDAKWLYAKRNRIDWFLTAAKPEHDAIVRDFGYGNNVVKLLGFPRFDTLYDMDVNKDEILVMPTWRTWLNGKECTVMNSAGVLAKEDFATSEYFKKWNEFLNCDRLKEILNKYNKTITFYPHRNVQEFIDYFDNKIDKVHLAKRQNYDIQALLKRCSMIITDFSSVFMDVVYMQKPVMFYQFDEQKFRKGQYNEGYFSYKNNPYSLWAGDLDTFLDNLDMLLAGSKKLDYNIKDLFPLHDNQNCKRVYDSIAECFDK